MGTPEGVVLFAVIGGAAALVTLIVVRLWPKDNDSLHNASARFLARWRRFAGLDD